MLVKKNRNIFNLSYHGLREIHDTMTEVLIRSLQYKNSFRHDRLIKWWFLILLLFFCFIVSYKRSRSKFEILLMVLSIKINNMKFICHRAMCEQYNFDPHACTLIDECCGAVDNSYKAAQLSQTCEKYSDKQLNHYIKLARTNSDMEKTTYVQIAP